MIKYSITLLVFPILLQCGKQKPLSQDEIMDRLSILAGDWQVAPAENSFEKWKKDDEGLSGFGYTMNAGDTIITELLTIKIIEGEVYYVPTVIAQNEGKPVPFQLTEWTRDKFRFERPEHDFPQVIQYLIQNNNTLDVLLQGNVNGQNKSAAIKLKRKEQ